MIFKIIGGKAVRYDSGGTDKIDDSTVDFSQAESRENISSADNVKTILGKIMKWFSDLSAGAASSLLGQNLTAGKVLISDDGGKVAASAVDASKVGFLSGATGDLQEQINSLNSAIENLTPYYTTVAPNTSIFGAPAGVYNLGYADTGKINDLPPGVIGGRTVIITSGSTSRDEKVVLLMNSKNGSIYFGYQYGSNKGWRSANLTNL